MWDGDIYSQDNKELEQSIGDHMSKWETRAEIDAITDGYIDERYYKKNYHHPIAIPTRLIRMTVLMLYYKAGLTDHYNKYIDGTDFPARDNGDKDLEDFLSDFK